jgi:hypothetical protein
MKKNRTIEDELIILSKRNRTQEYELLGKTLVLFETVIDEIRWKIQCQFYCLGLENSNKGETGINILLAKVDANQLLEKFRSIHTVVFTKNHVMTKKIDLFYNCVKQLIELRNIIIHATWIIGYDEKYGTEPYFSRGFNDRYDKNGLKRKVMRFQITNFKKIDNYINELIKFLRGFEILEDKPRIEITEEVSEEKLHQILSFFKKCHDKMEVFHFSE